MESGQLRANRNIASPAQSGEHSSWRAFWKILTSFNRSKMAPYMAFRNAAGMLLSLATGTATHVAFGGSAAALGALFVSYSDGRDPYRHRAFRMIAASVTIACAAFIGGMSDQYRFGVGVVAAAAAFVAGMSVAFGETAMNVGTVSLVMLTIFSAQHLTPESLLKAALLALLGGLIQTALSVAFWPVRRYDPERRTLASLFLGLGRAAEEPIQPGTAPPASLQMSQAQGALRSLRLDSGDESLRYQSLLNQAERARLSVIRLLQMQAALGGKGQPGREGETLSRLLSAAGRALKAIGTSLLSGMGSILSHDQIAKVDQLIEEMRLLPAGNASALEGVAMKDTLFQMDALAGQLRAAADLAAGSASLQGVSFGLPSAPQSWRFSPNSIVATLRANLNLQSAVFRHAVRLMICLTIAGMIAHATNWSRSYWIPMTVVILLRPDFAATFSRGLLRIAGTIAGLIVATAQIHFLPPTLAVRATLIGICVFLLRWLGLANYGFFVVCVTAAIVLLISLTGVPPKTLIQARAIDTLIGGALALSAYALWPTREPVDAVLADLLAAYREYFRAVAQRYLGSAMDEALLSRARLAARLARSNLEASIERLAVEPSTDTNQIELVRSVIASSHRFVNATMVLEAGETKNSAVPASPEAQQFVADVQTTLLGLESMLHGRETGPAEMPDLRSDFRLLLKANDPYFHSHSLETVEGDTIVNSLNTVGEQILRWREQRHAHS